MRYDINSICIIEGWYCTVLCNLINADTNVNTIHCLFFHISNFLISVLQLFFDLYQVFFFSNIEVFHDVYKLSSLLWVYFESDFSFFLQEDFPKKLILPPCLACKSNLFNRPIIDKKVCTTYLIIVGLFSRVIETCLVAKLDLSPFYLPCKKWFFPQAANISSCWLCFNVT